MKILPDCSFFNLLENRQTMTNFSIDKMYIKYFVKILHMCTSLPSFLESFFWFSWKCPAARQCTFPLRNDFYFDRNVTFHGLKKNNTFSNTDFVCLFFPHHNQLKPNWFCAETQELFHKKHGFTVIFCKVQKSQKDKLKLLQT